AAVGAGGGERDVAGNRPKAVKSGQTGRMAEREDSPQRHKGHKDSTKERAEERSGRWRTSAARRGARWARQAAIARQERPIWPGGGRRRAKGGRKQAERR